MRLVSSKSGRARLSTDGECLVREHLWLVPEMLRQVDRRLPAHIDRDDLAGAGSVALVEAALVFDPERGFQFPSFAAKRVRGAMLDELRRWDWAPRSVRGQRRRTDEVVDRLRMDLGREPGTAEIAAAQGMSVAQLRRSESDSARGTLASLSDVGPGALVADAPAPDEALLERERCDYLRRAVNALPERERRAIVGYYLHERPMRELATELGVSESRISQLCRSGLALLRRYLVSYMRDRHPGRARRRFRAAPRSWSSSWSDRGAWPMVS